MNDIKKAKVYVGSYGAYANGSLKGGWLTLSDYKHNADLRRAIENLHNTESEIEPMYQDWENIPYGWITEGFLDRRLVKLIDKIIDDDEIDGEALYVFLNHYGYELRDELTDDIIEIFKEKFRGKYDELKELAYAEAEVEFAEQLNTGMGMYFDYDAYLRDLMISRFWNDGEYVFWKY